LPASDDTAAFIESDGADDVLVRVDANYCLHASYSSQGEWAGTADISWSRPVPTLL
jgi:hypothetical protein